ncbi:MAG: hypothetical protein HPKKFMNG_02259 [Planctomycetes bacterium]|nr:hypothetical protein [Planctomycetota bacterium]
MQDAIITISEALPTALREPLRRALASGSTDDWLELERSCAQWPQVADELYQAAARARELRHPLAEKLLAAVLTLAPDHLDASGALAMGYLARGHSRQAHALLASLRKRRAAARCPENARLDELLLGASLAAGMSEDARAAAYRLAIAQDASWEALLAAAEFFRAEKDLDAQRTLCARMVALRPQDPDAHLFMAQWLHDEGYDEEAQRHLEQAAALASTRQQAVRARRLLFELRHPEDDAEFRKLTESFFAVAPAESLASLDRLTRRHPDLAEAWLFYGFALRRERRLDEAMRAFERCARLSDDPNAHKELAAVYGELLEPRLAERSARRALESLGEHDRVSWINLAAALAEQRRLPEAREALARAASLKPGAPEVESVQELINEREKPRRGFYNARLVKL